MKQYQHYKCKSCGNEVEVLQASTGSLSCCNTTMQLIEQDLTPLVLQKAIAGESIARNKYEYFAKIAQKEGYRDIAEHFQRAANNEKVHAKLELRLYNNILFDKDFGTTLENLKEAIEGESYENITMYPEFSAIAKEEGYKEAARILAAIGKIEIEHENMYKRLLNRLEDNLEHESTNEEEEWICEVCGHVHRGKKPPKKCPVCAHPQEYQSRLNAQK